MKKILVTSECRIVPKGEAELDACDDACSISIGRSPRACLSEGGRSLWFGISDGASGSVHAGLWAKILTTATRKGLLPADFAPATVRRLARIWRRLADKRLALRYGKDIPWYLEAKAAQPAHAALLGVEIRFEAGGGRSWIASAIGDACLFHVRSGELSLAFPIADAADFGNDPDLLPSDTSVLATLPDPSMTTGSLWDNDRLYLMTDALAAWFLSANISTEPTPWTILDEKLAMPVDDFDKWIQAERDSGRMRDDDVTLLRLVFELE